MPDRTKFFLSVDLTFSRARQSPSWLGNSKTRASQENAANAFALQRSLAICSSGRKKGTS
jgi:hypothetical protein